MKNATCLRHLHSATFPGIVVLRFVPPLGSSEDGAPRSSGDTDTKNNLLSKKRLRILVVDDQRLFRKALAFSLRQAYSATVEEAARALEAIDKIRQGSCYDVILMDVAMPGMSGIDACREIWTLAPETRIVLMSANAENESRANAIGVAFFYKEDDDALEKILLNYIGDNPA